MNRKHAVFLIAALVLFTVLVTVGTVSANNEFPTYPTVTVLATDESGTTLRIDFPGFRHTTVQEAGQTFDVLEISDCGKLTDVGKPALPMYGTRVAIPQDKYFYYATVVDSLSNAYQGYNVYPAQPPADDMIANLPPPFPTPPFTIEEQFYATDAQYPVSLIQLDDVGWVRDEQVLPVWVTAFQFNPVTDELVYYGSVTIRVEWTDDPVIIGAYPKEDAPLLQSNGNTGCDFLIVTDPTLLTAANTLATRRNAQGLSTLVVDTGTTGTTADNIKAYIQTAYDTWSPRPSYVLLLGDANLIPTFYRTVHHSAGSDYPSGFRTGTDLYYAIMNGPEASAPYFSEYWTPDLALGRIPADTLAEANAVVAKIAEYEDHQWVSGEDAVSVSGYFQDNDDNGYEDRRFILTSEEIRDFLVGEGYTVDRLYTTPASVTPTNYNNGAYDAGAALPAGLLRPGFAWDADAADITSAINDGRFVFFHRDHGGSNNRPGAGCEGWGDPFYEDTDVASLTNNGNYLVVFSIDCETGWFDGETDDYTAGSTESFCEALIRRDQGGAVGVIGASRISQSGPNDDLDHGFLDGIWPTYDVSRGGSSSILRMGDVLNYGKAYLTQFRSTADSSTKEHFELYHYFGDPAMQFKIPLDNTPPIANPGGPYTADENTPVVFDGSGSSDPDPGDSIALYEWDLNGDGVFETTGMNPTYTWCDDYTGTVTLRVTDTRGATATASTTVTVNNVAPAANAGPDQTVNEADTVQFTGSATDTPCDTLTYAWDLDNDGVFDDATGTTASFSWCDNGVYTVTLRVIDDDGGSSTDSLIVTVNNVAPTVTMLPFDQPNPQFVLPVVHTLTFHGTFTDPGCDTWTYAWNFGDGTAPASGSLTAIAPLSAQHAFGAPGDYTVTLTVTDDDSGTDSKTIAVHVADAAEAKHDLAAYIQGLPATAFRNNADQRKNAFANMFRALDAKLANEAWNGFIQDITNNVRSKADGQLGGNPADDWITDTTAQQHVCMKIDDIVAYVRTLM